MNNFFAELDKSIDHLMRNGIRPVGIALNAEGWIAFEEAVQQIQENILVKGWVSKSSYRELPILRSISKDPVVLIYDESKEGQNEN